MSLVFWDMFTGSAPYREIFYRTVKPRFIGGFAREIARAAWARGFGHEQARATGRVTADGAKNTGGVIEDDKPVPSPGAAEEKIEMAEGILGREYADGELLCRQGEQGDRMFVIQAGRVEVVHEEGGRESPVGELGPGEAFGQMAMLDRQPRSATVRARGKARVLTLDKRAFLRRVHEDPSFAFNMLEGMSQVVRRLDDELALIRNASQIEFVRYVYVAPANRPDLFEQLSREFENDREVEVVLRRRGDRRGAADPWSVSLSLPFRRGRGRSPVPGSRAVS